MKGHQILAQHMPDIRSWRILLLVIIGVLSFLIPWWIMRAVDRLIPAIGVALQLGLLVLAFLWLREYFYRKETYLIRYRKAAYQQAFMRHILTGLPLLFAVVVHISYLPGERIVPERITTPVEILAWYLMLTGTILDLRAIFTLGIDSLALLYVYFPEDGHLVKSSIYQVIRHPVYSALIRIGLALGLWRGTLLSIIFGIVLPPLFVLFWMGVEEQNLIERFGNGYREYRKKTPAFWPRLSDLGKFWRFLLLGDWMPARRAS